MKYLSLIAALLSLQGCATIREHPYATGIAVAFIAGSIAASAHHDDQRGGLAPTMAHISAPNCSVGACE